MADSPRRKNVEKAQELLGRPLKRAFDEPPLPVDQELDQLIEKLNKH